jgi:predicted ArsR family transcriptional regulator
MDRKTFIKCCCLGACSVAVLGVEQSAAQTGGDKFIEKTHRWIADMMRALERHLDEKTRLRIMEAQGRACYAWFDDNVSHVSARYRGDLDKLIAAIRSSVGDANCRRESNTIFFNYGASPEAKRVDRRECLCPLVAAVSGPLSPTFCACSVGYVKEMFERVAGKPADVQLLESLKRGGKQCRFKITM